MNTNTQTVDERCAELAERGMLHARKFKEFPYSRRHPKLVRHYADQIIAERTREQEAKS